MGVFPEFGNWINQNTQEPLKAESKSSENVKPRPVSKNNETSKKNVYYDRNEEQKQDQLWVDAEKNHPWYDAPPKVKVTTKNGICHMNIEFTVGLTPNGTYDILTNPSSSGFFDYDKWRPLLQNKSTKILKKNGPRQIAKVEKSVALDFLWWSVPIPINLIVDENQKDLTTKYKTEKFMFMKIFEGNWKIEPIYVDSERLCNNKLPKSREEYKQCSGGQGKIASKVIMRQYFKPYPPFNMPPVSWFVHGITIKTTKTLLKTAQKFAKTIRQTEKENV